MADLIRQFPGTGRSLVVLQGRQFHRVWGLLCPDLLQRRRPRFRKKPKRGLN